MKCGFFHFSLSINMKSILIVAYFGILFNAKEPENGILPQKSFPVRRADPLKRLVERLSASGLLFQVDGKLVHGKVAV